MSSAEASSADGAARFQAAAARVDVWVPIAAAILWDVSCACALCVDGWMQAEDAKCLLLAQYSSSVCRSLAALLEAPGRSSIA